MITSLQNERIKRLVHLRKRRDREEAGVMLVEGHAELAVAVSHGVRVQELYYCTELMSQEAVDSGLLQRIAAAGGELVELTAEVFAKAAYREGPDGWLAVVPAVATGLADVRLGSRPLVLVVETIEKPGNLGAMLRTALAVGANAVVSVAAATDWANPNVVRASKGAIFGVAVAEATPDELLAWLASHHIRLVAAVPRAGQTLWQANLTGGVAIAVGAEHAGLSGQLQMAAAELVEIPMQGDVDSLNASTAAAVLLYEALRQRQAAESLK
jgi:RNA methyltransferase, TrmH family